jgi:hypothetical protein
MGKTKKNSSLVSYCDVKKGWKRQVCIHVVRTYVCMRYKGQQDLSWESGNCEVRGGE